MRRRMAQKQRGVALLVVLILLVMMSVLASRISQQFCRNVQKIHYQTSQQQLRWAIQAQMPVIEQILHEEGGGEDKPLQTEGIWQEPVETLGEHYRVVSQVVDAQHCFNVNSLLATEGTDSPEPSAPETASPKSAEKPTATAQTTAIAPPQGIAEKPRQQLILQKLLENAGMSSMSAEQVYGQLVDYLDPDETTVKGEQESDAWTAINAPQLPGNQMMRTLNELRLLPAFPAKSWVKVSRVLCALPDTTNKVNINTLTEAQAPLLAALLEGALTEDDAMRVIASRPKEGWESVQAFEKQLEEQFSVKKESLEQSREFIGINSQYFTVNSTGSTDALTLRVVTQLHLDSGSGEVKVWQRRYRMIE